MLIICSSLNLLFLIVLLLFPSQQNSTNVTSRFLGSGQNDRILIGGRFTSVNGVRQNGLARLNSNGSLDTSFQANMAGAFPTVGSLALAPDGRVLAGGNFSIVSGIARPYVARLWGDISLGIHHSEDEVILSWPSGAVGYVIEESAGPGLPWIRVDEAPFDDGTDYTLNLPASAGQKLFRATQP